MSHRKHILLASILCTAISALMAAFFLKAPLTPALASLEGEKVDSLLRLLLIIGGVVFSLCLVFLVYNAIAFRHRRRDAEDGPPIGGNTPLEMVWALVPLAIVLWLAFQGAQVLKDISYPLPREELEVKVIAFQWGWRFEYPQHGITSGELRLPVDRPVLFKLTSTDVIHSFWVPEFRLKQDAVPGKETTLRITPTRIGSYKAWCAELCGLAHSIMQALVYVTDERSFEDWVKGQKKE